MAGEVADPALTLYVLICTTAPFGTGTYLQVTQWCQSSTPKMEPLTLAPPPSLVSHSSFQMNLLIFKCFHVPLGKPWLSAHSAAVLTQVLVKRSTTVKTGQFLPSTEAWEEGEELKLAPALLAKLATLAQGHAFPEEVAPFTDSLSQKGVPFLNFPRHNLD